MNDVIYVLYWIHKPEQHDPFSEGYIGISSNLKSRVEYHRKYANSVVGKAMRKYGDDIIIETLYVDLSEQNAKSLEEEFRPHDKIGWNLVKGGGLPPSRKNADFAGTKNKYVGDMRTDLQKNASEKHSIRMKGSTSPNKGKECPQHLKEYYGDLYRGVSKGPFTIQHKQELSKSAKNRPVINCPHCNKQGQKNVMVRWHFDNCKEKK